jgi:hypothetical protein
MVQRVRRQLALMTADTKGKMYTAAAGIQSTNTLIHLSSDHYVLATLFGASSIAFGLANYLKIREQGQNEAQNQKEEPVQNDRYPW